MPFAFRLRFVLGNHVRINVFQPEWVLSEEATGEFVRVKALIPADPEADVEPLTIEASQGLALWGSPYASDGQARSAGERWGSFLQVAFARMNIGADFGRRAAHSAFTQAGLDALEGQHGRSFANDVHGLITFKMESQPIFAAQSVDFWLGKQPALLATAVQWARASVYQASEQETLAFDLYSASFFESSADARYMMLMMAIETLMKQQDRSTEAVAHVASLVAATKSSALPSTEIASLVSSLSWLKRESLKSAGRRLSAERLGEREYMSQPAVKFFSDSYDFRSTLAHGSTPRPAREEVDLRAAELERFVGDLLSGPLLAAVEMPLVPPDSLPIIALPAPERGEP